MTLDQLSAAATEAIKTTGYKYFGDYELSKDQWEAVDALVEFARVVTHQLRTGQLVAVADDAIERVKAEARDKALDEAAEAVCGYIHPAYGELPGEPFASAAIRALKSPKPPIL